MPDELPLLAILCFTDSAISCQINLVSSWLRPLGPVRRARTDTVPPYVLFSFWCRPPFPQKRAFPKSVAGTAGKKNKHKGAPIPPAGRGSLLGGGTHWPWRLFGALLPLLAKPHGNFVHKGFVQFLCLKSKKPLRHYCSFVLLRLHWGCLWLACSPSAAVPSFTAHPSDRL